MGTEEEEQTRTWNALYDRIRGLLEKHGKEDAFARGDFWVLDDNWGTPEQRVEINNLALLRPEIVKALQALLTGLQGWKIVVAVDVREKEKIWPPMGLIIRSHEIVDGLQRQYFPEPFRQFRYEGSRPGTDRD